MIFNGVDILCSLRQEMERWEVVFTFPSATSLVTARSFETTVKAWCNENIRGRAVIYGGLVFRFTYEDDATMCYLTFK